MEEPTHGLGVRYWEHDLLRRRGYVSLSRRFLQRNTHVVPGRTIMITHEDEHYPVMVLCVRSRPDGSSDVDVCVKK